MSNQGDKNKIEQLLLEVVAWLRFQNRSNLALTLEQAFSTERERLMYELTDGSRSQGEIAKLVGVAQPTVLHAWNRWRRIGVVVEVPHVKGRCRRLVSLRDLGLEVPAMPEHAKETEEGDG
jgi:DNA-binding MarR family transcriptional regulator